VAQVAGCSQISTKHNTVWADRTIFQHQTVGLSRNQYAFKG